MIQKILLKKIPAKLLLLIEEYGMNQNISRICKKDDFSDCGWRYIIIKTFLELGLITRSDATGNSYYIELTEKGKELAYNLKEIKRLLDD